MRINFHGRLSDEPQIRAGFIGCGSHAFRNVYPVFQFAPVNLVATCDLDLPRAQAFAQQFGAERAYANHREMLEKEQLDALFIVTPYDAAGRPMYPKLAADGLAAGCHVWIEKPPAGCCEDLERLREAAKAADRQVLCGLKKMFMPANEHLKDLIARPDFGKVSQALVQYPQHIPEAGVLRAYLRGERSGEAISFLDHLCHPASLIVFLFGMPESLWYDRARNGGGVAHLRYPGGELVTLALTHGQAYDGGLERTTVIGERGHHAVVENNLRVRYHRSPPAPEGQGYGARPSVFHGSPEDATASWEPEFSLGQLYNKGLFLLGYYNEVNEFARAILDRRPLAKGTLEQAWQITRLFEAFAEGPRKEIALAPCAAQA
ncbi:MAG: Gfo/Idh/MocA family oxidoreductase [Planctomycetota bacterium]|nr:Gfo/Idh/MocA family oxidoreductase [Planctomycetota bacterium]